MKYFSKILFIILLTLPNFLVAQFTLTDSTKPNFLISYCNDREDNVEKPIHMDWVQKDIEIIRTKINKLPSVGSSISEIQKIIPHFIDGKCNCQSIKTDLGFGIKSIQHQIHGGYGTCNVDAIYFGDNVLKLKLTIENHKEIVEKYLFAEINLPFNCANGSIRYEKIYYENLTKYLKDSGKLFIESLDTNVRRRDAINYFTDVLTGGTFKSPYYVTFGLGSETFNHLRYFIVNRDYLALESILYSPSPTSRLFAARTLFYLQEKYNYKPSIETDKRIKTEISNARLISSGILSCWVNKFDYDYYDIVKDFEKLLMTE